MTPVLSNDIEAEKIGDEMVIYNAVTEAAVHLNQSSTIIYSLINGSRSTAEIVQLLSDAFPDADIEADVAETLQQLADAKVISYA